MTLRPRLVEVAVHRELRWRGRLVLPGLMDAEHTFVLQPQAGGTQLVHQETFRGVLVPFVAASLDRNTLPAFVAMNEALKRRAEEPARTRARTSAKGADAGRVVTDRSGHDTDEFTVRDDLDQLSAMARGEVAGDPSAVPTHQR